MKAYLLASFVLLFCVMGCVTSENERVMCNDEDIYVIDSVPQGLRVTVNDFERGVTPCKLDRTDYRNRYSLTICVEAPSKQQIKRYEEQNKKIVSLWWRSDERKIVDTREPGGMLRFNFIKAEYDEPKTEEEWEWVRNAIEEDVKELEEMETPLEQALRALFE